MKETRTVFLDIETDSLTPSLIWCVCTLSSVDETEVTFTDKDGLQEYLDTFDKVVTHNGIHFDLHHLNKLWGVNVSKEKCVDTLVLSRLLNTGLEGGHSLESWGERFNYPKIIFNDFSKYSLEMEEYCRQDVRLTKRVYDFIVGKMGDHGFGRAIEVEHDMQFVCKDMHDNGFRFDYEGALAMRNELDNILQPLLEKMQKAFPPKSILIREVTPKLTKFGTISKQGLSSWYTGDDYSIFTPGCPFSLVKWEPFNPGSPKQVIDILWKNGWEPVDKTDGHLDAIKSKDKDKLKKFEVYGWKINETNLATLPATANEACSYLVEYILTNARRRTLTEWMSAYNHQTKKIHGNFNPLGTRTQRCVHSNPNLGNIATAKTIKYNSPRLRELAINYGKRMRSFWIASEGSILVGTDMESAHLRIFGHLINDKEFIQSLIIGRKEDGTDPHSVNKRVLGDICVDRDRSKTFIFTFLNGGGANKVGQIFACSKHLAKEALDRFVRGYPGLQELKSKTIPKDASKGYFVGVDGRLVINDSEHHMIGMYLQNMESVLMKHANIKWRKELDEIGIKYKQVNWVHDEWVTEVYGSKEDAELVGKIQSRCIKDIGEEFGLRCPMGGEFKIGNNWYEVH